jgi:hypothetical protein
MKLNEMQSGTRFHLLGVDYEMVRVAGECQTLNRNQWGRSTGGTHTAMRVVVKVHRGPYRGGWSKPHYMAMPFGVMGATFEGDTCGAERCAWRTAKV